MCPRDALELPGDAALPIDAIGLNLTLRVVNLVEN
jgi:hypothetical protein